jgi:hypothetical protein
MPRDWPSLVLLKKFIFVIFDFLKFLGFGISFLYFTYVCMYVFIVVDGGPAQPLDDVTWWGMPSGLAFASTVIGAHLMTTLSIFLSLFFQQGEGRGGKGRGRARKNGRRRKESGGTSH